MENETNRDEDEAGNLGLMLPDVAHEIRNLMQSIQGLAELERRNATDPASLARLRKISDHANFAAGLASSLLRVSQSKPERFNGNVTEAVETVANLLKSDFGRGVTLQRHVDNPMPAVALPTGVVELILLNLAKTAVDASRDTVDPLVRISATRNPENIVVKIWNNGPHIPDAVLARIFGQRVTTKPAPAEHGLGLRVVRKLVEEAGGNAGVRNLPAGGVEFVITLPVYRLAAKVVFKCKPAPVAALHGLRFLVVDDDPSVRDILAMMIKDLGGGIVHTCDSGSEAVALSDHNFDVVLLDMRMKGLSGLETFQRLAPELQTKVVFVTGDVINATAKKFIEGVVRPVLIKPISFSQLCEVVAQRAS